MVSLQLWCSLWCSLARTAAAAAVAADAGAVAIGSDGCCCRAAAAAAGSFAAQSSRPVWREAVGELSQPSTQLSLVWQPKVPSSCVSFSLPPLDF